MEEKKNSSILKSNGNFLVILDLKCYLLNRNVSIKTIFNLIDFPNYTKSSKENFFDFFNILQKVPIVYQEQDKASVLFEFMCAELNQKNTTFTFKELFLVLLGKMSLINNIEVEEKKKILVNTKLKNCIGNIENKIEQFKESKINIYDIFGFFIDLNIDINEEDFSFIAFLIYKKTKDLDFIRKDIFLGIFK